jgi:hypothetical protein
MGKSHMWGDHANAPSQEHTGSTRGAGDECYIPADSSLHGVSTDVSSSPCARLWAKVISQVTRQARHSLTWS